MSSANTAIEWTDATWNPVRGCTKVSPGCKRCYAETFAERRLRTFDYALRNARPIRILMNSNVFRIDDMRFIGEGTELDLSGTVDLNARRIAGLARGKIVAALPGSENAVRLALTRLLIPELGHLIQQASK